MSERGWTRGVSLCVVLWAATFVGNVLGSVLEGHEGAMAASLCVGLLGYVLGRTDPRSPQEGIGEDADG